MYFNTMEKTMLKEYLGDNTTKYTLTSGSESSSELNVALSFRSMDHLEPVDVIARLFSGGGHRNAAAGVCSLDRFTDLMTYNTSKKISG